MKKTKDTKTKTTTKTKHERLSSLIAARIITTSRPPDLQLLGITGDDHDPPPCVNPFSVPPTKPSASPELIKHGFMYLDERNAISQ